MNVYLIGVARRTIHYKGIEGWRDSFAFVKRICEETGVDLIAEELNQGAIDRYQLASDSVARLVARDMNIRHLFCDPDTKERILLGIKTKKELAQELGYSNPWPLERDRELERITKSYWPVRERFWLDKMLKKEFKRCVFVLGGIHIHSFSNLLRENGISSDVIRRKKGV